jgi:hypothetical protein
MGIEDNRLNVPEYLLLMKTIAINFQQINICFVAFRRGKEHILSLPTSHYTNFFLENNLQVSNHNMTIGLEPTLSFEIDPFIRFVSLKCERSSASSTLYNG